jgi:hypothetical protein
MSEEQRVREAARKVSHATDGVELGVLMRVFGRITRALADELHIPLEEMVGAIIDEALTIERINEEPPVKH